MSQETNADISDNSKQFSSYSSISKCENDKDPVSPQDSELFAGEQKSDNQISSDLYDLSPDCRGECIILNYETFKNKGTRDGSGHDATRLEHVFSALGFSAITHSNLSKSKTLSILDAASKRDHKRKNCFVCCILTHGKPGKLYTWDESLHLNRFLQPFSSESCPSLKGKPKVFIIQACQGEKCEAGIEVESTDGSKVKTLKTYDDFLVTNASFKGTLAFRSSCSGSYYIQELCNCLEMYSSTMDLLNILTVVNHKMAYYFKSRTKEESSDGKKQMPMFSSTLTKKIFFDKKIAAFESVLPDLSKSKNVKERHIPPKEGRYIPRLSVSMDSEKYDIKSANRVQFLALINEKDDYNLGLPEAAAKVWVTFRELGFSCTPKYNLKKEQLKNFLQQYSKNDLHNVDCLVCFVATYFKKDYLWASDFRYSKQSILDYFTGDKCGSLAGKPKIFVFLMCKSPKKKTLVPCGATDRKCESYDKVYGESTDSSCVYTIPVHADSLEIGLTATDPHHLRSTMEILCRLLKENHGSKDLLEILTMVNCQVVSHNGSCFQKQDKTLYMTSTLTRKVFLP